jgi:hypothetical protein
MSAIPDLTDIVAAMIAANRKSMFGGWLPGRIETYDAAKCKASIQILLLEPRTMESGAVMNEPIAIINEVPVLTIADHHGIRMELALEKGDLVTVLFASRSVDRWLQRGGMIEPGDERDHDLNDAIAVPGLFTFNNVRKPTAKIKFTQTTVEIGGDSALVTRDEFLNHTHATAATGTPSPPIIGGTAGSAVTFPGTSILKGG